MEGTTRGVGAAEDGLMVMGMVKEPSWDCWAACCSSWTVGGG